jgi:citrate synthase
MGIPTNMFTVMFAIGRLPGWIAQWKESMDDPMWKLGRPRQVYTGPSITDYIPIHQR